jgi:hypothetical protein
LKNVEEADASTMVNFKTSDKIKYIAEWIDEKSKPLICLTLKPSPQKNRLKKMKYTFDMTLCDHIFDILLENQYIRITVHQVIPSAKCLEERVYCKRHKSFDHSTNACNIFCQKMQSAIDKGQLKFPSSQDCSNNPVINFEKSTNINSESRKSGFVLGEVTVAAAAPMSQLDTKVIPYISINSSPMLKA